MKRKQVTKPEITVRFYTILREKTGKDKIKLSASTVFEVIEELKKTFKEPFISTFCGPDGNVKKYFIFLLNGKTIDHKKFKSTKLHPGDELHIFPPIAGG